MDDSSIFKLQDICFSVNNFVILKNVNLSISKNDFIVLLGPSGSGKSTLLRLLNCLNSPTAGQIFYNNSRISEFDVVELRKQVGMVFQTPTMINDSVKNNLAITQNWNKDNSLIGDDIYIDILNKVGLGSSFLDKGALSLSGGEKQRVALARVLLNNPKVLLLDEPTANLDPQLSEKILKMIYDLYRELNLTILLVSHDYRIAKKLANRAIFLTGGEIVEEGTSEIIYNPKTQIVKNFIQRDIE